MNRGAINLGNPVSSSPLNRGLVGWWLALPGRTGGGRYLDLCQPGNHGVLTNTPTWVSGVGRPGGFYGALNFAGATQEALVTGNPLLGASAFTISVWFLCKSIGFAGGQFVSNIDVGSTGDSYQLDLDAAASAKIRLFVREAFSSGSLLSDAAITANTWTHAAATRTAAGALTMYVNGVAQAASATIAGTFSQVTNTSIGKGTDSTRVIVEDDLRLHNVCLSADAIAALYNDSRTGYPQTLNRLPMRVYGTAGGAPAFSGISRARIVNAGGMGSISRAGAANAGW